MKTVVVEVTEKDIADGLCSDAFGCPVALAIRRAIGIPTPVPIDQLMKNPTVGVTGKNAYVWHEHSVGDRPAIPLPKDAEAFVDDFDHQRTVQPFTFQIEIPNT